MKSKWIFLLLISAFAYAEPTSMPTLTVTQSATGNTYSLSLQIIALMTMLTLLPAILLAMTSFTRIIIVLSILRQAIGLPQVPTNQILLGLSLFLTIFIMAPVFKKINESALQPYLDKKISIEQAIQTGQEPMRSFMTKQIRKNDLKVFLKISRLPEHMSVQQVPFSVLIPSFITSELKTAFQMGFLIFLPFLVIDLVVASVLMSMGMMMLSPMIISMPFKIMLFILVDGWALTIGTLAKSFGV